MTNALVLGSTGQVGQHILKELLLSSSYTRVGEYARRPTDLKAFAARYAELEGKTGLADGTGAGAGAGAGGKLRQVPIDFEKLVDGEAGETGKFRGDWDVVFVALGTTRNDAGSAEAFKRIDKDYVIAAAKAALESNTSGKKPRLVYISSVGADKGSSFLYTKTKGETEAALAGLGYSETIVFRPGMLAGTHRPVIRPMEQIASFITSALSKLTDSIEIKVADLGQSALYAAKVGVAGLPKEAKAEASKGEPKYTIIANAGSLGLARLFKAEQQK